MIPPTGTTAPIRPGTGRGSGGGWRPGPGVARSPVVVPGPTRSLCWPRRPHRRAGRPPPGRGTGRRTLLGQPLGRQRSGRPAHHDLTRVLREHRRRPVPNGPRRSAIPGPARTTTVGWLVEAQPVPRGVPTDQGPRVPPPARAGSVSSTPTTVNACCPIQISGAGCPVPAPRCPAGWPPRRPARRSGTSTSPRRDSGRMPGARRSRRGGPGRARPGRSARNRPPAGIARERRTSAWVLATSLTCRTGGILATMPAADSGTGGSCWVCWSTMASARSRLVPSAESCSVRDTGRTRECR